MSDECTCMSLISSAYSVSKLRYRPPSLIIIWSPKRDRIYKLGLYMVEERNINIIIFSKAEMLKNNLSCTEKNHSSVTILKILCIDGRRT